MSIIRTRSANNVLGGGAPSQIDVEVSSHTVSPFSVGKPNVELNTGKASNDVDVTISGDRTTLNLPDPNDSTIDGIEIFGAHTNIKAGGKNNTNQELGWVGALRGVTIVGGGSSIENENSWKHTPLRDESGVLSPFLFQQGVCILGRSSNVSVRNEGTIIGGEYLFYEVQNIGVLIIGKQNKSDESEKSKYNSHINHGIIIQGGGGTTQGADDYTSQAFIEFPSAAQTVYGYLKGNIRLDSTCNIWDENNKQIVKDGVLQGS